MKLKEIEISRVKSNNSTLVLEAILKGHTIKIKDSEYVLARTKSNGFKLCVILNSDTDKIVFCSNMEIGDFIFMCEEIEEEDMFIISSNIALND